MPTEVSDQVALWPPPEDKVVGRPPSEDIIVGTQGRGPPPEDRVLSDREKYESVLHSGEISMMDRTRTIVRPVIQYLKQLHESASEPLIGFGNVPGRYGTIHEAVADPSNTTASVVAGINNALGEAAAPFTSPEGIFVVGGIGKLVSSALMGSGTASWAARALSAWFAAHAGLQSVKEAQKAIGGASDPNVSTSEETKHVAASVINATMAAGGAAIAAKPLVPKAPLRALPTTQSTADALGYLDLTRTDAVDTWVNADKPAQALVYAKDAVATATERAANTAANDIEYALGAHFQGNELSEARKALVFAVEAGKEKPITVSTPIQQTPTAPHLSEGTEPLTVEGGQNTIFRSFKVGDFGVDLILTEPNEAGEILTSFGPTDREISHSFSTIKSGEGALKTLGFVVRNLNDLKELIASKYPSADSFVFKGSDEQRVRVYKKLLNKYNAPFSLTNNGQIKVSTSVINSLNIPAPIGAAQPLPPPYQSGVGPVSSGISSSALDDMRTKIQNSKHSKSANAQEAIRGIDFAQDNLVDFQDAVAKHNDITQAIYQHAKDSGIEFPYRENYVLHAQDFEVPAGFEEASRPGSGGSMSFRKMRTYDTYADSIANGVDPKTLDGVDLLRNAVRATQRAVNNNLWFDSLQQMVDPKNGEPLLVPRTVTKRPDGTTYLDTTPGYSPAEVGGRPMAIQNGYAGLFDAMTKPSSVNPTLLKINATAKSFRLAIDTFHLGRLAAYQIAGELSRGEAPIPHYQNGLLLLDNSMEAIGEMANRGEIPRAALPQIAEDKAILDLGVNQGLNAGRIADSLHQEWIQKIPGLGQVNKFIFEKFQRGAIADMFTKEFRYQQEIFPHLSNEEIARNVASDVNTRLGNLGSQGVFKSKTSQDMARLVFLAPQWNEALLRSEGGAAIQLAKGVPESLRTGQFSVGLLGRTAATLGIGQFAANQLINLYTRGTPTWENPEEGLGSKLSAWIPDKIGSSHGFFLNPMTLPAEVTHVVEKSMEKTGDIRDALATYFRGRVSSLLGPAIDIGTKKDAMGRPLTALGTAADAIPIPIASGAAYNAGKQLITGKPSESFPGQFQKQLMASGGLRTDNAPSPEQRIGALARDYNKEHGITPNADFNVSEYAKLAGAIRIGNADDAKTALVDLLDHKQPVQIMEHFMNWQKYPFTGSLLREVQFFNTLNPEQKSTYQQARKDRVEIAREGMIFIGANLRAAIKEHENPKAPKAEPAPVPKPATGPPAEDWAVKTLPNGTAVKTRPKKK